MSPTQYGHFLRKRHQVTSQGTRQFPEERVFGSLGVLRLSGPVGAFVSFRGSQSESRMPEIGTSGWMSGMGNGATLGHVLAPILDSTDAWFHRINQTTLRPASVENIPVHDR
jgi:hypothetical protein